MAKKIKTFKEFLESKKKEVLKEQPNKIDWNLRKENWLKSVDNLYRNVDLIIVTNFNNAGYNVKTKKDKVQITEDYIGTYTIDKYTIIAETICITFEPIGTIIVGANGRVNMILPRETVKIVLPEWENWKIVSGLAGSSKLLEFNEKNILKLFKENL